MQSEFDHFEAITTYHIADQIENVATNSLSHFIVKFESHIHTQITDFIVQNSEEKKRHSATVWNEASIMITNNTSAENK